MQINKITPPYKKENEKQKKEKKTGKMISGGKVNNA